MRLFKLFSIGIISSFVLGILLKTVEQVTNEKVYVLLLNVDYFPYLKYINMTEAMEFFLHIIVSVGFVFILYYGLKRFQLHGNVFYYSITSSIVGLLLYFTTTFSDRTPALFDISAIIYWLVGHFVYGFIVGLMIHIFKVEKL